MRLGFYRVAILTLFGLLAAVLFGVQVVRGSYFFDLSQKNSIRLLPQEPFRGKILDRAGNVLADNVLSFDVAVVPQEVKDKEAVFGTLAGILSTTPAALSKAYNRKYLTPSTPVILVSNVSKNTAIAIEEQHLDMPGVAVEMNTKRFYPNGAVASHVLGYLGEIDRSRITKLKEYGYDMKDWMGYSGLEETQDIYLRGEKGGQQVEVDSQGRQVRLLGYKPPVKGRDVQTTLDLELQQIADNLLKDKKGAFVLMDVSSGEILVLSSSPGYDPNVFIDRKDSKALDYVLTAKEAPLLNRATCGQFPPGSVFKPITAAAALKTKKIKKSTTFVCSGRLKVGDRYFKCWSTHGPQDFNQAMGHSCDVYFYHLGFFAGADSIAQTAREFGLAEATGVDLTQESAGVIPNRLWKRLKKFESWYDGDTANFSIGQGYVLTTPLQLARMMAAIANGGTLVKPHLMRSVEGAEPARPQAPAKVKIAGDILDLVRESLRYPVMLESGTARRLEIPGLEMCAKTGTAQVYGQDSHGWVAGFFPLSQPKYAYCVLVQNAGSSAVAVEAARELFEEARRRGKI